MDVIEEGDLLVCGLENEIDLSYIGGDPLFEDEALLTWLTDN